MVIPWLTAASASRVVAEVVVGVAVRVDEAGRERPVRARRPPFRPAAARARPTSAIRSPTTRTSPRRAPRAGAVEDRGAADEERARRLVERLAERGRGDLPRLDAEIPRLGRVAENRDAEPLRGKTEQVRAIARPRAAVAHGSASPPDAVPLAEPVGRLRLSLLLLAVRKARQRHRRQEPGAPHCAGVEVRHPAGEILDGREDAAVADLLPVRDSERGASAPERNRVAEGAFRNELRVVVAEPRRRHAEWHEDPLGGEARERPTRDALDHDSEQEVAGVRVPVALAGREVDPLGAHDGGESLGRGRHVGVLGARRVERIDVVLQAAAVVEQVAERHRGRVGRKLRHEAADVVVERERAVAGEERDRRGGELLRDRAEVEDRRRRDRDPVLEVGHPEAVGVDEPALAHHADRAARSVVPAPGREEWRDPGDPLLARGLRRRAGARRERERQQGGAQSRGSCPSSAHRRRG